MLPILPPVASMHWRGVLPLAGRKEAVRPCHRWGFPIAPDSPFGVVAGAPHRRRPVDYPRPPAPSCACLPAVVRVASGVRPFRSADQTRKPSTRPPVVAQHPCHKIVCNPPVPLPYVAVDKRSKISYIFDVNRLTVEDTIGVRARAGANLPLASKLLCWCL